MTLAAEVNIEVSTTQVFSAVGWLGSQVVSMLDSGAVGPGPWVQIAATTLLGNSLRQTVHTHRASVHQAVK